MSSYLPTIIRKLSRHPAPPGVRSAGVDAAPDGWAMWRPRRSSRMATAVDAQLIRVTDAVARGVTRRALIGRAAAVGAGGGLLASDLLFGPTEEATAYDPCGPHEFGCGPSPFCHDIACRDGSECATGQDGVHRRGDASCDCWEGFDCIPDDRPNCWLECCNNNVKKCCDCCVKPEYVNGGNTCGHCVGDRRACICRNTVGSC